MSAPLMLGSQLVLCNVSLASVPLPEMIPAAAAAGFGAISVLGRARRNALRRAGLTDRELRAMAADHGLAITDIEAAADWLGAEPADAPAWLTSVYGWEELLDIAHALGASTLVAVHPGAPVPLEEAAAGFARLCDRAANAGLRVALEFPAWMTIGSLATAWDVVRTADRPNGGLLVDLWHHRRSSPDDELLCRIPADRISSVQLSDAAAVATGSLVDDVQRRRLPGDGDLDPVGFLRTLDAMGVHAPVGIEVFDAELVARGPAAAAAKLMTALRDVVDTALVRE